MLTKSTNILGTDKPDYEIVFNTVLVSIPVSKTVFIKCDVHINMPDNQPASFSECVFIDCVIIDADETTTFVECAFVGECNLKTQSEITFNKNSRKHYGTTFTREPIVDKDVMTLLDQRALLLKAKLFVHDLNEQMGLKSYNRITIDENLPFDIAFISNMDLGEFEMWLSNSPFEIVESYFDHDESVGIPYHSVIHVVLK